MKLLKAKKNPIDPHSGASISVIGGTPSKERAQLIREFEKVARLQSASTRKWRLDERPKKSRYLVVIPSLQSLNSLSSPLSEEQLIVLLIHVGCHSVPSHRWISQSRSCTSSLSLFLIAQERDDSLCLLNDPPSLPRVVRSRRRRRVILPRQQPRRRTRPVSQRGQANRKAQSVALQSLFQGVVPASEPNQTERTDFLLPSLRPRSSPLLPQFLP